MVNSLLNISDNSISFSSQYNYQYNNSKYGLLSYGLNIISNSDNLKINDNELVKIFCGCGDKYLYSDAKYGFSIYREI